MDLIATRSYERAVRKLLSLEQREAMEAAICADPRAAPVIPGSGGIRKFRWTIPGRGKRGGVRTIYFFYAQTPAVYLLTVYAKAEREDLKPGDLRAWARLVYQRSRGKGKMIEQRTELGREVEEALTEVLTHLRGEVTLPARIVDDPSKLRIMAVRKKLSLSRLKFAERYHLDPRTVQDWEQGRRTPDQAARVLLTVIEREPEAVERALTSAE